MTVAQSQFRAALLDAKQPVPDGLQDRSGQPAGARFSVYRNNVVVSLSEALATAFPLVRKLLGSETFNRLAGLYVRAHPPTSPLMMFYGQRFPAFLDQFEPLKHIGYLSDCARLDLALRASYHAADADALDPAVFSDASLNTPVLHLRLAPATHVLRSSWPLYDIWRFNTEANAPKPRAVSQDVLVTRPEFDPIPWLLPKGAADWLDQLETGTSFEDACEATFQTTPDFDLQDSLTVALTSKALTTTTAKET